MCVRGGERERRIPRGTRALGTSRRVARLPRAKTWLPHIGNPRRDKAEAQEPLRAAVHRYNAKERRRLV